MEYAGGMAKLIAIHDESGEEILVNADRIATVHNVSVVPSGSGSITMKIAGGETPHVKEDFDRLKALVNAT